MKDYLRNHLGQFTDKNTGSRNHNWRGDNVAYSTLHIWVTRHRGRPRTCEFCGATEHVHWANKSRQYRRDLEDWMSLCVVCHRKYDGTTKLSREDATAVREAYDRGMKQISLAQLYQVDQGTISNIVNHKIKYYG